MPVCGRYILTKIEALSSRFGLFQTDELLAPARFNIAPSQQVPVVVENASGRSLRMMRWGFHPEHTQEARRPPPINARAETLLVRPLFREALATRRCIIPADGFYEWAVEHGKKARQPIHIRLKDRELFGLAGLYTGNPDLPRETDTCIIVTTAANRLIAGFHSRMPVVLNAEDEALWLDHRLTDPRQAASCLRPLAAELMEAYPVSTLVSSVLNDGPELVKALSITGAVDSGRPTTSTAARQLSLWADMERREA